MRPRGRSRTALLVVDVQRVFHAPLAGANPAFADHLSSLLSFCRGEGVEVIHLRSEAARDPKRWMLFHAIQGKSPIRAGSAGVRVEPFARPWKTEKTFVKDRYDGFLRPDLLRHLGRRKTHRLYLAGLVTSVCILHTATGAYQRGLLPIVVDDCCADDDARAHRFVVGHYAGLSFLPTTLARLVRRHRAWESIPDRRLYRELTGKRRQCREDRCQG